MYRSRWFLALTLVVALSTSALAIDWPQWRGPNRDNVSSETGLLKSWPKEGPPLLWKATGLGIGYSTVSLVGDRLYTMGDGPDSSFIRCISMDDHKILWSAKVGKPGGDHAGTRCTPTVDGDKVYALGQWGDLVCVTAADGKEIWRKSMKGDFAGKMMSGWGYSESPLVDGEKVLVTPGGNGGAIVALNKTSGEVIWRSKEFTDAAAYSSIVPAEIGGVKQYVQLTGASVAGIAESGKLLWKAERKGDTAVVATPIVKDDCVFVTSSYKSGRCDLFKINKTGDSFKTEEGYSNTDMANHHGGVVLVGDYIYGHSDRKGWLCMEFKTGKVMWSEQSKLGKGSIAYADGHLYCRAESGKGTVVLIESTPSGWKEGGRFDQPNRSRDNSWPQPVVADGKLFIRDHDTLLCYDVKG